MNNAPYKGGSRMLFGFMFGVILALLIMTVGYDSGYFTPSELVKYSLLTGGAFGFFNFLIYELTLDDGKSSKLDSGYKAWDSSNYISDSSANDSGGGGSDAGGGSGH